MRRHEVPQAEDSPSPEDPRNPDSRHKHGGAAPVTWRCTRYVAVHPNRRGALPTDRVQCPNTQEQTRNWHTEPLTAAPLHAQLGPTGGRMGTPPTPPPALRPTPAHSDTSYTLTCEEPVKGHYTRSERVQCLRIGCTTPRHKLTCGPARMEVDGPDRLSWARRRSPDSQRGPETAGLAGLRDNAPSGRAAEPGHGAHIRRARARGTHTTSPDAGHTYDEAGASRAQQHDRAPAS